MTFPRSRTKRRLAVVSIALGGLLYAFAFQQARAASPPCRYTVTNGGTASGTVYDVVTGLTWQQSLSAGTYSWYEAQEYCSMLSYAGFSSGWRVPTMKELVSIVDYTQSNPSIDSNFFPNTPATVFWTSTGYQGDSGSGLAWYVYFLNSYVNSVSINVSNNVRCVR